MGEVSDTMDLATLSTVLQSALSTNPEERKAGEERLNQVATQLASSRL